MSRVKIIVDRKQADYTDLGSLPLQLSKSTDQFFEVVGTGETEAGNASGNLILPATKPNLAIFDQPQDPNSDTEQAQGGKDVTISTNGRLNLQGRCRLARVEYEKSKPSGLGLEVYGGAEQFFGLLGGLQLNELPLGDVLYDQTTISASWSQSYPDIKAQFPVVGYRIDEGSNGAFAYDHFRPHVYFPHIVEGIGKAVGYTIESVFFGTEFFRNHLYLFGVGNKWRKSTIEGRFETFRDGPLSPPAGNFSYVPISSGGSFPVQLQIGATDQYNVTLSVGLRTATDVRLKFSTGETFEMPPGVQNADPLILEDVNIQAGTVIEIEYKRLTSGTAQIENAELIVESVPQPTLGSRVDLASCLHREPVIKFLRGISHMFNLAWYVEPTSRKVFVEPRFPYSLQGVRYPGFYYTEGDNPSGVDPGVYVEDWIKKMDPTDISMEFVREHGDALILRPQYEDSFLMDLAKGRAEDGQIFCGGRLPMIPADEPEEVSENPYFENVVIVDSPFNFPRFCPVILPEFDGERMDEFNFESKPKWALYEGLVGYFTWSIDGSTQALRPLAMQSAPNFDFVIRNLGNTEQGAYNSTETSNASSEYVRRRGYIEIFYPDYYACLRKGLKLTSEIRVGPDDFYDEDFRKPKKLKVGTNETLTLLTKIEGYNPAQEGLSTCEFVVFVKARKSDADRIQYENTTPQASINLGIQIE